MDRAVLISVQKLLARRHNENGKMRHSTERWTTMIGENYGAACKAANDGDLVEWAKRMQLISVMAMEALDNVYQSSKVAQRMQDSMKDVIDGN